MLNHLLVYIKNRQSRAIGCAFMLLGLLFGSWATTIPFIKAKFELKDAELGLLLLCLQLGAVLFTPMVMLSIRKYGMRQATFWGMVFLSLAFAIPIHSPNVYILILGLLLTGMGITQLNVAMNTCASAIEEIYKINIMATQHGLFSVGLMSGAFLSSALMSFNIHADTFMTFICLLGILLALVTRNGIFSIQNKHIERISSSGSMWKWPDKVLMVMIIISLCINKTEGAMVDWTAIYLDEIVSAPAAKIGWGFAAYSAMMTAGRLLGDGFIPRLGGRRVLMVGSILSFIGIFTALFGATLIWSIIGFGMVGLGVSCGAPILYGSAARLPGTASGEGLATMNTFSMIGFMGGPVLIGFISSATTLSTALSLLMVLAVIWFFYARRVILY